MNYNSKVRTLKFNDGFTEITATCAGLLFKHRLDEDRWVMLTKTEAKELLNSLSGLIEVISDDEDAWLYD